MAKLDSVQSLLKDRKNVAILALSVVVVVLLVALAINRSGGIDRLLGGQPEGQPVEIVDVVLDRTGLQTLDIFFDRPLGEGSVGDVLAAEPAIIRPTTGGTWRWFANNVLRFAPTDRLGMAMAYEVELVEERLLGPQQYFVGDTEFEVVTDSFQVERVDTVQEPRLGGDNEVVVRGNIRFNYPVEPRELATRLRLIDPLRGAAQPIEVGVETYGATEVMAFRSDPVRKEAAERELRLVIRADLTPAEGNVPLGSDYVEPIMVGSREILQVWQVIPEPAEGDSRLRLRLSSPVDPQIAADYVALEPQVDYRLSGGGNDLVLTGALVPGESYTLTIAEGLPATDDASLREAFSARLRVPDLPATLEFQGDGMFLSAEGARRVAIESINVERADLVVERVYRNNLHYLFQSQGYSVWSNESYSGASLSHSLGDRVAEETLQLSGERNRRRVTAIDLDPYIADAEPGLYRIAVGRPGTYTVQQRWLLITDMGMVAKVGSSEVQAWVSSFDDLQPVAAASLTLLDDQNQLIARGRSDAAGRWSSGDVRAALREQRPYLLVAEKGDDFSFVLLDEMRVDPAGLDVGGASTAAAGYEGFLYGERDIYRPGETVEGVAVLRDRRLRPPPAMPVVLRHRDPEGLERGSQRVASDAAGLAAFELEIPDYARTGNHTLELLVADEIVGRYRFQVEEFVPDRIRVGLTSAGEAARLGADLEFEVESAYLFGPPAAGLSAESRVRLEAATFAPAGYGDYSFSNGERDFNRQEIFEQTENLDEQGRRTFTATLPDGLRVPSSLSAVITARVQEQGGRGVFAQHTLPVHPYPYYVGLRRAADSYAEPGVAETFDYVALAPGGAAVSARTLQVEFFKDEWNTVLRRAASGNFRYESTRVSQLVDSRLIAAGTESGSFELSAPEFGAYRVVITDPESGASAQVSFYASGFGYSPWAIENPARIELELDRDEYRPGDTALVQVRSPFAGKLLLTVERDDVFASSVHRLDGNTATIELPIPETYRPNAYVTATVIRAAPDLDADQDAVARAFGAVPIFVDRSSNRLEVSVAAVEEIRPGSSLQIDVATAPNATLTVAAVDEGILQLINQATADPFAFFYRKLALAVRGADNFSLLLPEVGAEAVAAAGGGDTADAAGQYVRTDGIRRVVPVAFWSGVLRADASGNASVSFDLPQFQGALRLMAVAHEGRRFGSAAAFTRVRDPLVLLPTFPRFLSFEETARIPVTVRNDTGGDGEFQVTLSASGAVAVQPPATVTVAVAEGTEQTVYLEVTSAGEPGAARLDLAASGNGETTTAGVDLAVKPDLPVATDERMGSITAASTTLDAPTPSDFRPGTVSRSLRLGSVPLVQFAGQLSYLVRYPYGCLEQITSRVFPLIYLGDLAREVEPELFEEADPAAMVQDAIRHLATLQHFTGGFSMWPNGAAVAPWPSIYAGHFLVEARRGGFLVPDYLYDGALRFLANEARARQSYAGDELERVVYALYVSARAGAANLGTMDFIRERHLQSLRPQSRALLAGAYAAIGRADAVPQLTAGLGDVERIRRQTGGNFNSETRNRAMLLLGLLDAVPDDQRIAALAQRLARDAQTNRWWNTQESSFALLALGELFRRQAERPPYAGAVTVGGDEIGRFDDQPQVFERMPATGEVRVDMDPGYQAGSAFFSLRTRGVPTDEAFRPLAEGLELSTDLRRRDGGAIDLDNVQQGDLMVLEVRIRSAAGRLENVAVQILLPAGFEIENPRLSTRETLPWISSANLEVDYFDFRDDQVLLFLDLPDQSWRTGYVVLRAVTPGTFRLPPIQAEAMYEPQIRAVGERGTVRVVTRQ